MACLHQEDKKEKRSDYFDLDYLEVEVSPDEDTCQSQLYSICRPKQRMEKQNDNGYATIDAAISFSNPTNITNHCSYHGVMSRKEVNALLLLAPKRGYIIRYSENQNKYILSVAIPSSGRSMNIEHFMFAIDTEVPSYGLKGGGKSFPSLEELLKFYESNWLTPKLGSIGNSCTQMDTTMWLKEHEMKKKKEEEERKKKEEEEKKKREEERKKKEEDEKKRKEEERKKEEEEEKKKREEEEKNKKEEEEKKKKEEEKKTETEEAREQAKQEIPEAEKGPQWQDEKVKAHSEQRKLKTQQEQLLQMQADMTKQQMLFQQQMEDLKKDVMEPLVNQQKGYQQQILELQKANNELLQAIQKRDQRHHHKCCVQ